MAEGPIGQQEIANREHIAPQKTGDNIAAKKVAPYFWDGSNWQRQTAGLFPAQYDELAFTNPDTNGNYQTITSKLSGSTQNIIAVTYDASSNITDIHRTT